jgi:arylsulfatase A-like enzyme
MKVSYLLHGALMGACFAGWASLFEACWLFSAFPYQIDPTAWTINLPAYLAVGAALGSGCALFLPLLQRDERRSAQLRALLGMFILAVGCTATCLLLARMTWLPPQVATLSATALFLFAEILVVGVMAFGMAVFLGRRFLPNRLSALFGPNAINAFSATLILLAGISFLLPVTDSDGAFPERAATAAVDAPNVLLVVLDTVAASHLGSYGYERNTSPRLDQLASEGVLFEQHYAAAPWTLPSHASIFTSLHPNTHGAGWQKPRLADGTASVGTIAYNDYQTLAEELSFLGYDTCGVSEKAWLSAESGLTQGFESYWDFSNLPFDESFLLPRVFHRYQAKLGWPITKPTDKGGAQVVNQALAWLGGNRARDEDRPFFLFLNLNEAHDPYNPPPGYREKFLPDGFSLTATYPPLLRSDVMLHREVLQGVTTISTAEMVLFKALYDAEILYQDTLLGQLLDGLQSIGQKENTIIIITSDHGEEFGEIEGRVGHQLSLSDSLLHVPLVIRYPALLPAGRRVSSMASTLDIFPTILAILEKQRGYPTEKTLDAYALEGVSQLDTMQEGGAAVRDFVMAHYSNPTAYLASFRGWDNTSPYNFSLARYLRSIDMIRTLDDKLYLYGDGERAFLNLLQDPTEQDSALSKVPEEHRERASFLEWRFHQQMNAYVVVKELFIGNLNRFRKLTGQNIQTPANIDTSGMTAQELESIGYIGGSVGDARLAKDPLGLMPFQELQR